VDSWSLTVDIPASDLVRREGKIVRRTLGIPAVHNLRDWTLRNTLTKLHKAQLDAGLLTSPGKRWAADVLKRRLANGEHFDVLLIRRAPRPLDSAIHHGQWKHGGRMIYGDNASSAVKGGRDWTAKRVFGLDGDSSPLLRWHVGQERSGKAKLYQLSVLIAPAAERWYELPDRWLRGQL
jgi:hypothetical protein